MMIQFQRLMPEKTAAILKTNSVMLKNHRKSDKASLAKSACSRYAAPTAAPRPGRALGAVLLRPPTCRGEGDRKSVV